jgi:hypothetical protein
MNMIERRQYEMLVRVRDFGDNYGHLFPASSVARESFTAVAAARVTQARPVGITAAGSGRPTQSPRRGSVRRRRGRR